MKGLKKQLENKPVRLEVVAEQRLPAMCGEVLTPLGCFQPWDPWHEKPSSGASRASSVRLSLHYPKESADGQQHAFQTHTQLMETTHRHGRDALPVRQSGVSKTDGKLPQGQHSGSATSKGELSFSKIRLFCLQTHCFCQREFFILGALGKLQSPQV